RKRDKKREKAFAFSLSFLSQTILAQSCLLKCLLVVCQSAKFLSVNSKSFQNLSQEGNLCLVGFRDFLESTFSRVFVAKLLRLVPAKFCVRLFGNNFFRIVFSQFFQILREREFPGIVVFNPFVPESSFD